MRSGYRLHAWGVTAAETLVAVGILAALVIPTWGLFVGGRGMAVKSKFTYLALLAARDEIADLRITAHTMLGEPYLLRHDWKPVTGSAVARLDELNPDLSLSSYTYSKDQARVFTKLEVLPSMDGGETWPATLNVRWQERGERVADDSPDRTPGLSRFDFILVKPRLVAR